jgi:uncharacterized protein YegP (UPF0339 family)
MHFEKYRDARNEWRWRLYADNGKSIAVSGEGYEREAGCDHAIALIKRGVTEAEITCGVITARVPMRTARLPLRSEL